MKCICGHEQRQHIYEEGACRPGFVCECEWFNPVENTTMCNHIIGYRHSQRDANLIDLADGIEPSAFFAFCPKCGEKL